jgi:toxin ParE1/3/4
MLKVVVAPAAKRDIELILSWTHEHFGEQGQRRYEALLTQSILDIAADPAVAGSVSRPEIGDRIRTYHLSFSRLHVSAKTGLVKHPRHFLLYRIPNAHTVEIGRVLHDSMDLDRHIPDSFGPE